MITTPTKLAKAAAYWHARDRHEIAERFEVELRGQGRCVRCGRTLTDPRSVADSIGPECRRRTNE
jgi:hypothetical protein